MSPVQVLVESVFTINIIHILPYCAQKRVNMSKLILSHFIPVFIFFILL